MGSSRVWRGLAVLLVIGLLAAACSSDSKKTASGASSGASSSVQAPTGPPLLIAILGETSVAGSDFAASFEGMEAWAALVNSRGGINGRPIKTYRCDTKLNPTDGGKCTNDAIANKDVLVIAGGLTSLWPPIIAPAAQKANILTVPGYSVSPPDGTMPNSFVPSTGPRAFLASAPSYLVKEQGLKKVAVVRADLDATAPNADIARKATEAAGGQFVDDVRVPVTSTDMVPAVTEAAAKGAQVILPSLTNAGTIGVLNAIRDLGLADQMAFVSSPAVYGDPAVVKAAEEAGVKWYLPVDTDIFFNKDNPAHQDYLDAMKLINASDDAPQGFGWLAFEAGLSLEQILKAAGPNLTRESILNTAMHSGPFNVPGYPAPLKIGIDPTNPAFATDSVYIIQYPDKVLTPKPISVSASAG